MSKNAEAQVLILWQAGTLNFRENLLEKVDSVPKEKYGCSITSVMIEDLIIEALTNNDSQVSCLFKQYYREHFSTIANSLVLTVVSTSVVSAAGGKHINNYR